MLQTEHLWHQYDLIKTLLEKNHIEKQDSKEIRAIIKKIITDAIDTSKLAVKLENKLIEEIGSERYYSEFIEPYIKERLEE